MYVVKTCNANLTCTYPPCYALDNFTELFKSAECVVLALDLQHSTWIAVRGVAEHGRVDAVCGDAGLWVVGGGGIVHPK